MQVAACAQGRHLINESSGQHGVETLGDALMQPGPVVGFQGKKRTGAGVVCVVCYFFDSVKARQRLARDMPHLQRTLNALAVAGGQARGRHWVHTRQLGMQGRPALLGRLGFDLGAHLGVGGGHVVNAIKQGLEVQHGAAHQQWQCAARADLGDEPGGVLHKLGGAVGLQRIADVDEVVRHGGALVGRGLGGANVHAPVHQGRVHADDLDRPALFAQHGGQRQCAGGLARRRGARQGDGR